MADDARLEIVIGARIDRVEETLSRISQRVGSWSNQVEGRLAAVDNRYNRLFRGGQAGQALNRVFDNSRLAVIDAGARRLGVFGSALEAIGPAGLLAAGGVAALAISLAQAREAARFASDLQDTADRLHVTTDALQEYRFALAEVGGRAEEADAGLQGFTQTLGAAQGGARRAVQAFAAIGITRQQLESFRTVDQALQAVSQQLQDLSDPARAAALERLRATPLGPLLEQGPERMNQLRQRAEQLGVVMDGELVRRGAQANREFETLAQVVDVQLKSAFVDLAPVLTGLLSFAAGIAREIADIVDDLRSVEQQSTRHLGERIAQLAAEQEADAALLRQPGNRHAELNQGATTAQGLVAITGVGGAAAAPGPVINQVDNATIRQRIAAREEEIARLSRIIGERGRAAQDRAGGGGAGNVDLTTAGSSTDHTLDIARRGQDAIADANAQILEQQRARLQAERDATRDLARQGEINEQLIDLDRQRTDLALQKRIEDLRNLEAQGDITHADAQAAIAANERARLLNEQLADFRKDEADRQTLLQLGREQVDYQQEISRYSSEIADIEEGMAATAAERRAIAFRDLSVRQSIERSLLEQDIVERQLSQARGDDLRTALRDRQAAEARATNFQTRGPLEQFRDQLPTTADRTNEALQQIAVDGLDQLVDQLVDAASEIRSFGDVLELLGNTAANVAQQILQDLLRLQLQQPIVGPAVDFLGPLFGIRPGGVRGGGSVGVGDLIPGNAGGTDNWRGGYTWVGENGKELVNLPGGSKIYSNASIRSLSHMKGGGAALTVVQPIYLDAKGAITTAEFMAQVTAISSAQAHAAATNMGRLAQKGLAGNLARLQLLGMNG